MPTTNDSNKLPDPRLAFRRVLRLRMTDAERKLWHILRNRQFAEAKFGRQHPFGPCILDFYCREHDLAIELDGGQHFTEVGIAADAERTRFLSARGVRCLRFTNLEVLQETGAVIRAIELVLNRPSPCPSPPGRGNC